MNTRIMSPKRHLSRAWENSPYWQTELLKHPERSPVYASLTEEDYASIPDHLKMPTTRAGLNAMAWDIRKSVHGRHLTKTVHHDKFWRRFFTAAVLDGGC